MKLPAVTCIDFETCPIFPRPAYPPVPVGVSLQEPGQRSPIYLAWGHPTQNNTTKADAARVLKKIYASGVPLLHHHGKFDVDVAVTHLGCKMPSALLLEDTLFLLFLHDPHQATLSLKPASERILGMQPTEQQAVAQWLVAHQDQLKAAGLLPCDEPKLTLKNFGKWICLAPGSLVGTYAKGDVTRTLKLFKKLYPEIVERGMLEAYQREQKLMPILLQNEREGIRCDERRMAKDIATYTAAQAKAEAWLRKTLKAPSLNLEAPEEVAEALDSRGIVTEWVTTAKSGKRSTAKKNMTPAMFSNAKVASVLGYHSRLSTCLGMYFKNWYAMAQAGGGGRIFTSWNQVRQSNGGNGGMGARTGRLSASLFMNVPKQWSDKNDGYLHPEFLDVLELPLMRRYVLPDAADHWLGRRDFNQQELRILAHYEDGDLLSAYLNNPGLDVHAFVQKQIAELLGVQVARTPVKTLNFGYIYGQGINSMAEKLGYPSQEMRQLRDAQMVAVPGLKDLSKSLKDRWTSGEALTTWGGREYFCEPPAFSKKFNKQMSFEYRSTNYLIQPSAADITKEAIIRWHEHPKKRARMVVTVHDEIDPSAPKGIFKEQMLLLRDVMMSIELDVPLLSDAEYGPNWADLKDLKEPEADLSRWNIKKGWSRAHP